MLHVMSETLQIAEDFISFFGTWTGNGDSDIRMDEGNVSIEFV